MEKLAEGIAKLNQLVGGFVWGPVMIGFLLLAGLYFTVGTGFFQFRRFGLWLRGTLFAIFRSPDVRDRRDPGAISQFQALATALAGTIGTRQHRRRGHRDHGGRARGPSSGCGSPRSSA